MAGLNVKIANSSPHHIHKTETKLLTSTYAQFAHIEKMVKTKKHLERLEVGTVQICVWVPFPVIGLL